MNDKEPQINADILLFWKFHKLFCQENYNIRKRNLCSITFGRGMAGEGDRALHDYKYT